MKIFHITSEKEYREKFHDKIEDKQTLSFSKGSIDFHNRFYDWEKKPIMCLEHNDNIVSVLFYNNTKDKYCSIINILTQEKYRKNGFAKKLITEAIKQCYNSGARRIRLNCDNIEGTIKFYNKLGFFYWGVTRSNALYCNLPLISNNIQDFNLLQWSTMNKLLDIKSIKLIERRISPELSSDLCQNMPWYLPYDKYFYNRFLEYKRSYRVRNFGI